MRKSVKTAVIAVGAGALVLGPTVAFTGSASAASSKGLRATGLVDGTRLVGFSTSKPGATSKIGTVKGLTGGDSHLVGIDYRVQDGKLYGVGDKGGVYTLSTKTAAATFVLRLSVGLEGTNFGVDFNPAANALRVVSDTGQNLRQPFATAGAPTVADTKLSTPPTAGDTTGVSAAAYTNNDTDEKTATILYDINTAADTLAIQAPANAGTLSPAGSLKVDAGSDAGFDIYTKVRKGTAVSPAGYASLSVDGSYRLYRIALSTGKAVPVGKFDAKVTDLAVKLNQS